MVHVKISVYSTAAGVRGSAAMSIHFPYSCTMVLLLRITAVGIPQAAQGQGAGWAPVASLCLVYCTLTLSLTERRTRRRSRHQAPHGARLH